MNAEPEFHVILVSDDPALEGIVRELLATVMPTASLERAAVPAAGASNAGAAIVDEAIRGAPGIGAVQEMRTRGYRGGIVLLAGASDAEIDRRLLALGPARSVVRAELVEAVPAALAELAASGNPGAGLSAVQRDLRRIQQLVATGESITRIQHTLNNPLTALLAEAQLLEMEPLGEENLAAVKRIVEQCRRMVAMVRGMDTTAGAPGR